jgi:ribosomal protein L3 glutamine methyltransferase
LTLSEQDFTEDSLINLETITDFLRFAYSTFNSAELYYGHGTDNSWDEAVSLILGILYLPWDADKSLLQSRLTAKEKKLIAKAIQARVIGRIPVPYIVGEGWFMGLSFEVNPQVLIPRSPIAELLEIRLQPWLTIEPVRILDLCCGSACIGIAAAVVFAEAEVVVTDISEQALAVAARNIERHHVQDRVQVLQSDLFQQVTGKFDVILSNPPYVDSRDMSELPAEYHHEPRLGLASGEDGLDATRDILANSLKFLNPAGILVCEVGNSLTALLQLFPDVLFDCPEFERGGTGVFVLTYDQLVAHNDLFNAAC